MKAKIELRDLMIAADIGTYAPDDVVPNAHVLDMTLTIDPRLVLIEHDAMEHVFDYDPLIKDIERISKGKQYETQEGLISRIVAACAAYPQIDAVSLTLSKTPVLGATGSLGVNLIVDAASLGCLRGSGGDT